MSNDVGRFTARLRRRTSGGRYLPEIDGVRFLAIGIVVIVHVLAAYGLWAGRFTIGPRPFGPILAWSARDRNGVWLLQYGHVGVYLFFVVSGFVLAAPYVRWRVMGGTPTPLSRYYLRRVTRIEPPFLVMTLILFVVSSAIHEGPAASHLFATISYSHLAIFGDLSPLNGVFWSLEAEVQWYLVVPILAVVLCRGGSMQRRLTIATLMLACVQLQALDPSLASRVVLLDNIQFFLVGWLLADVHVVAFREAGRDRSFMDAVGLSAIPLLFIALRIHPPSWRLTLPLLCGLIVASALHGHRFRRVASIGWIAVIGGMCYSIYLVHYPLLVLGSRVGDPIWAVHHLYIGWLVFGTMVLVGLALSVAFFLLVERPCMDPAWPGRLASHVRIVRDRSGGPSPGPLTAMREGATPTATARGVAVPD
jgi:peptidoglycan/LPS O-acetylase OafA/YrhL